VFSKVFSYFPLIYVSLKNISAKPPIYVLFSKYVDSFVFQLSTEPLNVKIGQESRKKFLSKANIPLGSLLPNSPKPRRKGRETIVVEIHHFVVPTSHISEESLNKQHHDRGFIID
jgi:hypothetical protein